MKGVRVFNHFQKKEVEYGKVMMSEGATLGGYMSRLKMN
jgi:hypothetical protein